MPVFCTLQPVAQEEMRFSGDEVAVLKMLERLDATLKRLEETTEATIQIFEGAVARLGAPLHTTGVDGHPATSRTTAPTARAHEEDVERRRRARQAHARESERFLRALESFAFRAERHQDAMFGKPRLGAQYLRYAPYEVFAGREPLTQVPRYRSPLAQ